MRNSLGIVLPMGQNRKRLMASGQWGLWASELTEYRKTFGHVELFEYRHCDRRRFVEALLLPITERKRFNQCSVIKAVHLTGAIPCLMVKLFYGIPYVLSFGYRYDEFARVEKKWFQWVVVKLLTPLACQMAAAVILPTETIEKFVRKNGGKRVAIIPNGVDTTLFHPALKGRSLRKQGPSFSDSTILFVGRFEPQKNLVVLIEAIHLILAEGSDLFKRSDPSTQQIELTFIGQGNQQKVLGDTAEELGVSLNIIPPMPNDRLVSFYQQSDIFVLPSLVEGHPKALLEAMSCGLPVVASRIPGCIDIVTDGYDGLLVEPTANGLQRGLERIFRDQKLAERLGEHARQTIVSKFDKKKLMEKEMKVLYKTISDR